ncbi:hypothetical protein DRO33_03590 [Candidatus Bathyarchaeota archaeon]|mgnify:CR=1 FL=1|nr:MAG: hypothetical protein DRO33_03590 [Candidatus Bathyarchaeota archaeon]
MLLATYMLVATALVTLAALIGELLAAVSPSLRPLRDVLVGGLPSCAPLYVVTFLLVTDPDLRLTESFLLSLFAGLLPEGSSAKEFALQILASEDRIGAATDIMVADLQEAVTRWLLENFVNYINLILTSLLYGAGASSFLSVITALLIWVPLMAFLASLFFILVLALVYYLVPLLFLLSAVLSVPGVTRRGGLALLLFSIMLRPVVLFALCLTRVVDVPTVVLPLQFFWIDMTPVVSMMLTSAVLLSFTVLLWRACMTMASELQMIM